MLNNFIIIRVHKKFYEVFNKTKKPVHIAGTGFLI